MKPWALALACSTLKRVVALSIAAFDGAVAVLSSRIVLALALLILTLYAPGSRLHLFQMLDAAFLGGR